MRRREEVANAAGTSVSAISMYENGERVPRDAIKIKLAAFYKKSVQEIFFD
ncbi:MAG: helix-turn-helix transcriptional regulator [Sellimonas intestinalis]|uniref:helix-turn-helix transcriptional regulator n=1 Tax=Sellimonas intestinalis TaxID=1653434 RepID=UPI0039912A95